MIGIKHELPSKVIQMFMGDYDMGLYMCDLQDLTKHIDLSDGEIEICSDLDDSTKEMKPINGIFMLEDCYITKDGEIYQKLPTQRTKDGIEFIKRNHSAYMVQDIADKAFGLVDEITPFKHG